MIDENIEQKSFILVSFDAVNSTIMQINLMNVSPAQVLAATAILEVKAKNAYIMQENERLEREAQMQIAKPTDKVLIAKS